MKPLPIKRQIKQHIKTLFGQLRPGDILRTDDVVKYCKRRIGKQFYPDSGIRYMRELRKSGEINYTSLSKRSRQIEVLELGEPHSL